MSFTTVIDKAVNDLLTEADWDTYIRDNLNKGVVRPIAEVLLASAAASIDFTSIAADWPHLLCIAHARGSDPSANVNLLCRFNNDATAKYDESILNVTGTTVAGNESLGGTALGAATISTNTAPADVFGSAHILIPNYAGAFNKTLLSLAGLKWGTSSGNVRVRLAHGQWRSNAAINQITLFASTGNLLAGSRITLYGMGGLV